MQSLIENVPFFNLYLFIINHSITATMTKLSLVMQKIHRCVFLLIIYYLRVVRELSSAAPFWQITVKLNMNRENTQRSAIFIFYNPFSKTIKKISRIYFISTTMHYFFNTVRKSLGSFFFIRFSNLLKLFFDFVVGIWPRPLFFGFSGQ